MKLIQPLSIAALAVALTTSASAFPYSNPPYAGYVTTDEYGKLNAQRYAPPTTHTVAVFAEGRRTHHHLKASSHAMGNSHDQR